MVRASGSRQVVRGEWPLVIRECGLLELWERHLLRDRERRLLVTQGLRKPIRLREKRAGQAARAGDCRP